MLNPRRLAIITIPASCAYTILTNPQEIAFIGCIFLAVMAATLALILLPAVWSRKKYRRDASYSLVELITRSSRTRRR